MRSTQVFQKEHCSIVGYNHLSKLYGDDYSMLVNKYVLEKMPNIYKNIMLHAVNEGYFVLSSALLRNLPTCAMEVLYKKDITDQYSLLTKRLSSGVGFGFSFDLYNKFQTSNIGSEEDIIQVFNAAGKVRMSGRPSKFAAFITIHSIKSLTILNINTHLERKAPNGMMGLFIPDEFFIRLFNKQDWYFFDQDFGLSELNREDYIEKYNKLVEDKKYVYVMPAKRFFEKIVNNITSTGFPYLVFRDTLNQYSPYQRNILTLNLCGEIAQPESDEYGESVCNLLTINAARYNEKYIYMYEKMKKDWLDVDFEQFESHEKYLVTIAYFGILFINYSIKTTRRDVAITPTGFYDLSKIINKPYIKVVGKFAECIYFGGILGSIQFKRLTNITCPYYENSSLKQGLFQFDLRGIKPHFNWDILRVLLIKYGASNTSVTSYAPCSTTSLLFNNTESIIIPSNEMSHTKISTIYFHDKTYLERIGLATKISPKNDIKTQILIYSSVLPFVDGSISTLFKTKPNKEEVASIILAVYKRKFKFLYYFQFTNVGNYINMCVSCTQ